MQTKIIQVDNLKVSEIPNHVDLTYEKLLSNLNIQYWVHYVSNNMDVWENELVKLGLSDFEKIICNDEREFPRAEPLTNGIYLHIPISNDWTSEPNYIHIIMHHNLIISFSKKENTPLDKIFQNIPVGSPPEGKENIFFLILILEKLIEVLVNNHLEARSKINNYIKSMDLIPLEEDNDTVMYYKSLLGIIMNQCEENLFCFTLLKTVIHRPYIPYSTRNIVNDILDTLNHVQKSLISLDQRLEDQLLRIDSHLREQTDKRLRILTIFSSIFLPITFISGLYGMNFHYMPDLQWKWAYFACLGVMAFIVIGMLIFFAKRGWFK